MLRYFTYALLAGAAVFLAFVLHLDLRVQDEFEGRRFALPARIFARPLELHAGLRISPADVVDELRESGYREGAREAVKGVEQPGWFVHNSDNLEIALRPFIFWDGPQPARRIRVSFDGGKVSGVRDEQG